MQDDGNQWTFLPLQPLSPRHTVAPPTLQDVLLSTDQAPQPIPEPAYTHPAPAPNHVTPNRLTIRLPPPHTSPAHHPTHLETVPDMPETRRAARHRQSVGEQSQSGPSGSEYNGSNSSHHMDEDDIPHKQEDEEQPPVMSRTRSGRPVTKKNYQESDTDDMFEEELEAGMQPRRPATKKGGAAKSRGGVRLIQSDDEGSGTPKVSAEAEAEADGPRYSLRARGGDGGRAGSRSSGGSDKTAGGRATRSSGRLTRTRPAPAPAPAATSMRRTRSSARRLQEDDGYVDRPSSDADEDADASFENAPPTDPSEPHDDDDAYGEEDADGDVIVGGGDDEVGGDDEGVDAGGRPYRLRKKQKVNYAIPPPLEELKAPPPPKRPAKRGGGRKGPGWSATGAELDRWMRGFVPAGDDSDSDYARTPRKPFGLGVAGAGSGAVFAGGAGAAAGGGGLFAGDLAAAAGTPSNLGKLGDAALADADPLGVNQNVTFDEVGGLDDHINSLKEMTLLPLLYPEVFQRFGLTPPRGVLFHGPPGTGKTLLARALAASCRSNGKGISFFMRKGADCLSKWVGEAERQLRLLFEEAKNSQPSIIFFDEIDGLAPVRSSKQDQVHASIVSTLLALMDGMDGRGQVVVIGATNRPDAVDPALRRPGRFDREFYFPLPSLPARERILRIMTKKWEGWEGEEGEERVRGLARLTKGYGGADLRALCTEAALNSVQRRYPQIYKSTDRLLLKPETIGVELRDFMIAVKKLVPSSARSASTAAAPLPTQLVPLLEDALERAKGVVDKVMPVSKKRTALEEAEWEDESQEGALERELMLQSMETLRVYRPRVVLHGAPGMGQSFVGAAVLHHLEGYHVQSLDLGNLMGDSTRTTEAAIVQLFLEAKRNQPSVVYIPSLVGWCAAVTETARSTVRAMLDTLAPTDPILLLAVVDGSFASLPRDVRAWFGPTKENRVLLQAPSASQRERFFEGLIKDIYRPPNQFPDGIKRKKRVLEELPVAPPPEPRQPSAAELAVQEEHDQRTITLLKFRLGPILTELKRKFKRFTKRAGEEYDLSMGEPGTQEVVPEPEQALAVPQPVNGDVHVNGFAEASQSQLPIVQIEIDGVLQEQAQVQIRPRLFDMDLERIHHELYKNRYLTPGEFLDDIGKIVHNAEVMVHEDPERLYKAQAMYTAAEVSMHDFDPQMRLECERMAQRERKRRDEWKREREKEKGREANGLAPALGTRRSSRHNGQQLEVEMTDPVLIERRLKRQRSGDGAGDSQASGSEGSTGPSAKRSRMGSPDDLDLLGPLRANGVRFAEDMQAVEPLPSLQQSLSEVAPPPTIPTHSQQNDDPFAMPTFMPQPSASISSLLNPTSPVEMAPAVHAFPAPGIIPSSSTLPVHPIPGQEAVELPQAESTDDSAATTEPEPEPSQAPMEVEREPTPLPDFVIDDAQVETLKTTLVTKTESLAIEELEQLRATCLGIIWRHRSDWNRAGLIQELTETALEYVNDLAVDAASPI
ncbi:AAA-domain-containing protein [Punctularia strigosozonata HHB-11173 SS5]|uniref:AAA-domain-containing protein n=1 Tax=Punctularia strigosozonata (strain HHB-11173) TaxID=741275 RepID=R7S384_PUNST|nr:AAA-domain-containing protein [Punctularia strigosozonata HHB-11173 SS5]EIN04309.1 AAA-domain-containing protein [Punctularia strigosozonata HHB-11173 SS5]